MVVGRMGEVCSVHVSLVTLSEKKRSRDMPLIGVPMPEMLDQLCLKGV